MNDITVIVEDAVKSFKTIPGDSWSEKPSPYKWSKKEILGHLVDSAINNLQRFTEIQFQEKPYRIRPYDQDALVMANGYQDQSLDDIIALWRALNRHIAFIMQFQDTKSLRSEVELPDSRTKDLNWLMNDYVVHLQHHLKQILNNSTQA